VGIGLPKLQSPAPHRFIRNVNTAFRQQILNIAIAKWKAEIQPDGILDDVRGKSVTGIGDFLHPATLLWR
jgi:hypothetical protein